MKKLLLPIIILFVCTRMFAAANGTWFKDQVLLTGVNGHGTIVYSNNTPLHTYIHITDPEYTYDDVAVEYEINEQAYYQICESYPFEFEIPLPETAEYISFKLIAYKDCDETTSNLARLEKESSVRATLLKEQTAIYPGEKANITFMLTGTAPWNLKYQVGDEDYTQPGIASNAFRQSIDVSENVLVKPVSINDAEQSGGVSGYTKVYLATDSIHPVYDTYVHENRATENFSTVKPLELKTGGGWSREMYFSFDISKLHNENEKFFFRAYLSYMDKSNELQLEVAGNTATYNNSLNWTNKDAQPLTPIDTVKLYSHDLNNFIEWDITNWLKEQITNNKTRVTLRVKVIDGGDNLCRFHSMESGNYLPGILAVANTNISTEVNTPGVAGMVKIYPNPFSDYIIVESLQNIDTVSIYSLYGKCHFSKKHLPKGTHQLNVQQLPTGIYIIELTSAEGKIQKKISKFGN